MGKKPHALENSRGQIAAKVRELRQARRWTQAELSKHLHLSQSRLSEIEQGAGSFTAEQFLVLLKLFNVPATHFVSEPAEQDLQLQNALARLGALHLQESVRVLPSEQLDDLKVVIKEALVDGSPRIVTALAPVFVRYAERLRLPRFFLELRGLGLERRLAWVVENTLAALQLVSKRLGAEPRRWARTDRFAENHLQLCLDMLTSLDRARDQGEAPDILDATIRSKRTLEEVRRASSEISQRWDIITNLQVEDFVQALKAARAGH